MFENLGQLKSFRTGELNSFRARGVYGVFWRGCFCWGGGEVSTPLHAMIGKDDFFKASFDPSPTNGPIKSSLSV